MKLRKQRKHQQVRLRYNKSWDWAFDNFIRKTVAHFKSFDQAMQEAFAAKT
jgi:hypothetical protein